MFKPGDLPTELKSMPIMLIDDDEWMLDYLECLLRGLGVTNLVRAVNGRIALDLINQAAVAPQLLFCDLAMPDMDGIEFFRHLAERKFKGGIVIVSGVDRQLVTKQQRLLQEHQLKFLGTLYKPFSEDILISVLLKWAVIKVSELGSVPSLQSLTVEEIRTGIAEGHFETYFQPKVSLADLRVVGAECLVRWNHPQRGRLPPSAVIPVAEEHGLIGELTFAIFKKTLQYQKQWERQGHALAMSISINLSMESIAEIDLPDLLADLVKQNGLDTTKIIFELTESRLMEDLTRELEVVSRIRLKGFGLSIDDFGTGYSSVEKLRLLPLTELKIDRSFVHGAAEDETARIILESCVRMGRNLGINIVAEGVETQADMDLVKTVGCHMVQGYFFAPPMPSEEFVAWKKQWER